MATRSKNHPKLSYEFKTIIKTTIQNQWRNHFRYISIPVINEILGKYRFNYNICRFELLVSYCNLIVFIRTLEKESGILLIGK